MLTNQPPAPSPNAGLQEAPLCCGRKLTSGEMVGEEGRRARPIEGLFHFPFSGALGGFSDNNSSRASDFFPHLCAF